MKVRCSECGEIFPLFENGVPKNHLVELFYTGAREFRLRGAKIIIECPKCGYNVTKEFSGGCEEIRDRLERLGYRL
jgi:DNA-directed RNA polymerase subunit RPC12/RpoP